jgi:hypothetical protein
MNLPDLRGLGVVTFRTEKISHAQPSTGDHWPPLRLSATLPGPSSGYPSLLGSSTNATN